MKLKTLSKTARGWTDELQERVRPDRDAGDNALLAWEIIGGIALLFALYNIISMSPEVARYLKIKRM